MNTLIYNYFIFDLISWLEDFNINSFWISFWKSQNRKAYDLIF